MSDNAVIWMEQTDGVVETAYGRILSIDEDVVLFWNEHRLCDTVKFNVVRVTQGKFPDGTAYPEDFE